MTVRFGTLSLSQQVLERQRDHAERMAGFIASSTDISDATGELLAMFDPLSRAATALGEQGARAVAHLHGGTAAAVGHHAADVRSTDQGVGQTFSTLLGDLGSGGAAGDYPDLGGPTLGPAAEGAPDGYGSVDSHLIDKAASIGDDIAESISDTLGIASDLGGWGEETPVRELVDASSFLVPGEAPDNFVQDLRWSAGALLGSIDWVAEQFIGFSILDRCVYRPLAGDWQGIYRSAQAWNHAGDATFAIARNGAGLVASTPAGWRGLSGNAFRLAMTAMTEACIGLSAAFATAGSYTRTISTACKLACTGIGAALNTIANKLLRMAAQAATPVVGWASAAFTVYKDVNDVIRNVRLIYTIIETVASAIQDFVSAKTAILDRVSVIEDLVQGHATSAASA